MTIEARFDIEKGAFSLKVDLTMPARAVTALLGPSGCGKTTFLRAIAGLDVHQGGFLKVGDMIWQDAGTFIPPHQRPLGYVFQETSLFEHLSVQRNLEYGLKRVPETEHKVSLEQAIDLLGIDHLLQRKPDTLSGGERQRIAIARALAVSPRLLLMDEPLASLDVARKQEILPYLESLRRELDTPMIYVSHAPDEVARLADHVVLLENGRVVGSGDVFETFTRLDLPLAHGRNAETIIEAVVADHDDDFDLTYLDFPGGRFSVSRKPLPIGNTVRLRVVARDVSLTLEHQTGTSILNIFPGIVDDLIPEGDAQVTVRLIVGGVPVLSRVTRKSATNLDLHKGKQVYVQAKSVAVLS